MSSSKKDSKNTIAMLEKVAGFLQNTNPGLELMLKKEIIKLTKSEEHILLMKEVSRRLKIQNRKLLQQIESLRESLKQTKLNRNQILTRFSAYKKLNRELSAALGSCKVCWGTDKKCQACGGDGSPGRGPINKKLFSQYVLPSVEKIYGWKK